MIHYFYNLKDMNFGKLMQVYEDGNKDNACALYPDLDGNEGILQAEQDFYGYLKDVFFRTPGAFYVVFEESGRYVSAFRMEPYQDGLLLEALETAPHLRRMGYAKKLIAEALKCIHVPIYSHVNKHNEASLRTHLSCGFYRIMDQAVYVDGSVVSHSCTLVRK